MSGQALNLNATLVEAYDDDVTAEAGAPVSPLTDPMSGFYSMVTADVDYAWQGRRAQVGFTGLSALQYYSRSSTVRAASSSAGAGLDVNLSPRSSWSLNQTIAYSPWYFYGLFPSVEAPRTRRPAGYRGAELHAERPDLVQLRHCPRRSTTNSARARRSRSAVMAVTRIFSNRRLPCATFVRMARGCRSRATSRETARCGSVIAIAAATAELSGSG